jgi:hypothetical protein
VVALRRRSVQNARYIDISEALRRITHGVFYIATINISTSGAFYIATIMYSTSDAFYITAAFYSRSGAFYSRSGAFYSRSGAFYSRSGAFYSATVMYSTIGTLLVLNAVAVVVVVKLRRRLGR